MTKKIGVYESYDGENNLFAKYDLYESDTMDLLHLIKILSVYKNDYNLEITNTNHETYTYTFIDEKNKWKTVYTLYFSIHF